MKEEDILFYKSKYIFLLITFWFFLEKFILLVIIPNELIFLNVILEIIISFLIAMLLTLNIKNTKNGIRVGFLGVFFAIHCYFYANYFSKFFESNIIIELTAFLIFDILSMFLLLLNLKRIINKFSVSQTISYMLLFVLFYGSWIAKSSITYNSDFFLGFSVLLFNTLIFGFLWLLVAIMIGIFGGLGGILGVKIGKNKWLNKDKISDALAIDF